MSEVVGLLRYDEEVRDESSDDGGGGGGGGGGEGGADFVATCAHLEGMTETVADALRAIKGDFADRGPCAAIQSSLGAYCGCEPAEPPCQLCPALGALRRSGQDLSSNEGMGMVLANPDEEVFETAIGYLASIDKETYRPTCAFMNQEVLPATKAGSDQCTALVEQASWECNCRFETSEDGGGGSEIETTTRPTVAPTRGVDSQPPTQSPTYKPTSKPTRRKPKLGQITSLPTLRPPTSEPSITPPHTMVWPPTTANKPPTSPLLPTSPPTVVPTLRPTHKPTAGPSPRPTSMPTARPTGAPTQAPTKHPTLAPAPIILSTPIPTPIPTRKPRTKRPTLTPTPRPTCRPTNCSDDMTLTVVVTGGLKTCEELAENTDISVTRFCNAYPSAKVTCPLTCQLQCSDLC